MTTCKDVTLLPILSVVKKTMFLIQIIVPIILIVWTAISFINLVFNPDDKKQLKPLINRALAAVIIFFIPLFFNIVMDLVGDKTDISSCWEQASDFTIGEKN